MRVALITFCPNGDTKTDRMLQNLVSGSLTRGNQVETFNGYGDPDVIRLTSFDYIAVVLKSPSLFSGKLPARVSRVLATSGTIVTKKGCALVIGHGFFSGRTCQNLMRVMEAEGVKLDYFNIVRDADSALASGKKIG